LQKILLLSGRKEEVIEKIPEPFEYFEFILKPFEQKERLGQSSQRGKAKLPHSKQ